jgi:hypothetical protein
MGKELVGENVDGGQLMDPASDAFQAMLQSAKEKGEASLTVKQDTSAAEDTTGVETKESPSKSETTPEPDETSEDIDSLRNSIRGLKAELSRVRGQRSHSESEASDLKERLARMEGRMDELKSSRQATGAQDSLKGLTDDKLLDLDTAYEDELADARAVARLAERDGDTEGVAKANQRIAQARQMRTLIKADLVRRTEAKAASKQSASEEEATLSAELESLFTDVYKAAPELADKNSEIWKAGQAEYRKLPALTKRLGPLGELIATASAITKNPHLLSKKATEKVLSDLESVVDKSFNKGGTAPKAGVKQSTFNIQSTKDVVDFEEQVRNIKMG